MQKRQLFGEDVNSTNGFQINRNFEQRYLHNKKRVELEKLEQKFGQPDQLPLDSSDSEALMSEDSDGDILRDDDLVVDFLTTFAKIKNQDQDIYKKDKTFYRTKQRHLDGDIGGSKSEGKGKQEEVRNLRKMFLEGGMGEEGEMVRKGETPVEVQERLKREFQNAMRGGEGRINE